jgi:hypothetical protein
MKDLESRLREEAARERQRKDPGDAFWEQLPGVTWQAFQAESDRRQKRWVFWRRLTVPIMTTCAAAVALFLLIRAPHQPVHVAPLDPSVTQDADLLEILDSPSDDIAAGQPAIELLEHWHVPADVVVDELSDKQLAALAERLRRG